MNKHSGLSNYFDAFISSPFGAGFILALLLASILYGLAVCRPILPADIEGKKLRDADLKCYQTIVEQIHAGKSYYSAAGSVLRSMGYTTASVFNWRLPPLAWLLGHLPSIRAGQIIAFIFAIINLLLWLMVFHREKYTLWQITLGGLIMAGPVIYSLVPGPFLSHEFWAGTLIALSLAAYARGWRYASIASGLSALFLRELSLPFVCIMMVTAYMESRRREALIWLLGILAFGGELMLHWSIVSKLITENDRVLQGGWIVFGGWPFVLTTAQMHPFFLISPPWIAAIILPLSLLGLAGWPGPIGTRAACTVGIYVSAYMIAGRSFNLYWGLMYAFVMPLGLLHLPAVLRKLGQSFRWKKTLT